MNISVMADYETRPEILLQAADVSDEGIIFTVNSAPEEVNGLRVYDCDQLSERIGNLPRGSKLSFPFLEGDLPSPTVSPIEVAGGRLVIDLSANTVIADGATVDLHPKGYGFMVLLAVNLNEKVSFEQILNGVWGNRHKQLSNPRGSIASLVFNIRDRLGEVSNHIVSLKDEGYVLVEELSTDEPS